MRSFNTRLSTLRLVLLLAASSLSTTSVVACSATQDDGADTSDDALSADSNRIVLAVANNVGEDALDLDVGLGPDAARKVVEKRPFANVTVLRQLLSAAQVKKLLQYGQAHPEVANGTTPAPAPSAPSGPPSVKGLGCREEFQVEHAALDIEWFPPRELSFSGNRNDIQYYAEVPFDATATDTGISVRKTYQVYGQPHTAKLDVSRATGKGTFVIDGTSFKLDCYYISTTTWATGVR